MFRPTPAPDGRWQHGEVIEGFYLAETEPVVWAEWYRVLAELAIPPMQFLPRDLWHFDVDIRGVADLSGPKRLSRVGLPLPTPNRSEWPLFQSVGEALYAEGWPGVLYPSAAIRVIGRYEAEEVPELGRIYRWHPQWRRLSLVLFRPAALIEGVTPIPPPTRYDEPPAPPRGLQT
jgi:hypothetical protein